MFTDERKRLVLIGLAFLILLVLSYFVNVIFFGMLNVLFQDLFLVFFVVFVHNVTVVSLILLGMRFYVDLVVLGFFKGQKYEYVVLEHPRVFGVVFAVVVVFLSILRGSSLVFGEVDVGVLPKILVVSAPIGLIEGYGVYLTIKKVLSRVMSLRDLVYIYGIFFVAAVVEVGFIQVVFFL